MSDPCSPHSSSSSSSPRVDDNPILVVLGQRRSTYSINKELTVSIDEVCAMTKRAIRASERLNGDDIPPSTRVVFLFGASHDALWDMVSQEIRRRASPATADAGSAKVEHAMKAAAGTLLFFSDTRVEALYEPQLARLGHDGEDLAAVMGTRGVAAAEMAVWTALAAVRIGATLHHYNDLIEPLVLELFHLPEWWRMQSQMPVGGIARPPGPKLVLPMSERSKVLGMVPKEEKDDDIFFCQNH